MNRTEDKTPPAWVPPMEFDPSSARPLPAELEPDAPASLAGDILPPPRRGKGAARLLLLSLAALLLAALGFDTADLISRAFNWSPWAGSALAGLLGLAMASLGWLTGREALAWRRLRRVDDLRQRAAALLAGGATGKEATSLRDAVAGLYASRRDLAPARQALATAVSDAHDGREILALTERILLAPLDSAAYRLVLAASRDVAVGTALSPAALLDVALVLWRNMKLVREIAALYAARPGLFGSARLVRRMAENVGVAGMVEGGDGLLVDALGGTVAAAISARLGQGMVNGLLTARIGLAAMHLCRPLPFAADRQPGLNDIRKELLRLPQKIL
ncbi:TIGR01620 family protein [Niveispirillum sp. SYP-B3756]|uniref:TIGR01620 family protein n=1 Tax=Niveispirillum sp. SYP-B3756 TaxID=2662178 RepID=UPI0012923783|nr:TIGR01620 family protein [Niveispirillum sp. SYP-B3756]MQP66680.1 TIGR01620 family protein [Niveispirillum sp. SYP-B3756]